MVCKQEGEFQHVRTGSSKTVEHNSFNRALNIFGQLGEEVAKNSMASLSKETNVYQIQQLSTERGRYRAIEYTRYNTYR